MPFATVVAPLQSAFRNRRSIVLALVGVLALLVIAAAVLLSLFVPSVVRQRLGASAAARGLSAEVDEVWVGLLGTELSGVRVQSAADAEALSVVADVVRLDAGVFALALGGSSAVRRVVVDRLAVQGRADSPAVSSLFAHDVGEEPSRTSPTGASRLDSLATVDVLSLSLALSDASGPLMVVNHGSVSFRPEHDSASFTAGGARLGGEAGEGMSFREAELRLSRREGVWQLRRARASDLHARYRARGADSPTPGLRARLETVLGRRGTQQAADAGEVAESPSGDAPSDDPDPTAVGDDSEPPVDDDIETADDDGDGSDDHHHTAPSSLPSVGAVLREAVASFDGRLDPHVEVEVDGVALNLVRADETERVLYDLRSTLRGAGDGTFHLEGSGRPARGGSLEWDLHVQPEAGQAEGRLRFERLPFALLMPLLPSLPWYLPEQTRLRGQVDVTAPQAGRTHLDGWARVDDLALASPRVAPMPIRAPTLSFRGRAQFLRAERRLDLESLAVDVGGAEMELQGRLEWPEDHMLVDVQARVPAQDCNRVIGAIPPDVLDELDGFAFRGTIAGSAALRLDSRRYDDAELDIAIENACEFTSVPFLADVRRFQHPFRHRVEDGDGEVFEMVTGPGSRAWTPMSDISPFLVHAVLLHEDSGFFQHAGFSVGSIRRALVRNLESGRFLTGASTISMQLVKNVFLHREKTLIRKVQEVLLTWWIETALEKAQILELYLNVIEYGPQVYGIRNAAQHYFGRLPAELSPAQAAYLATILPNPKGFHEHWERGSVSSQWQRRVARFIRLLGTRRRYDAAAVQDALTEIRDLEFARPGAPAPAPRAFRGSARDLPFLTAADAGRGGLSAAVDIADPDEEAGYRAEPDDGF